MRSPPNAVRLVALVVAGMASGYLWRAVLEPSGPNEVLRATPLLPLPLVVTVERPTEKPVATRPAQRRQRSIGVTRRPRRPGLQLRTSATGLRSGGASRTSPTPQPGRAPRPTP